MTRALAALLLVTGCFDGSGERPCDSWCVYQRETVAKCEANDAEACFAMKSFAFHDAALAATEKACRLGHGPACTSLARDLGDLINPERDKVDQAMELYRLGCDAGDPSACAGGAQQLLAAGRAPEVRALVGPACERGDAASCRELARVLVFGIGGEADVARGMELLGSTCARGDHDACALEAFTYASGRAGTRDLARAHAILAASCKAGVKSLCNLDETLEPKEDGALAVVLSRSPIVLELAGPVTAPLHAEVILSVGGPFEIGPVSVGWFGMKQGAIREASPGKLVFRGEDMSIVKMAWLPGDIVHVGWPVKKSDLTQAACEAEYECKRGFCTASGGYCLRASAADCARAEDCTANGRCGWDAGDCVATAEGCTASTGCRDHGSCRLGNGWCTK